MACDIHTHTRIVCIIQPLHSYFSVEQKASVQVEDAEAADVSSAVQIACEVTPHIQRARFRTRPFFVVLWALLML